MANPSAHEEPNSSTGVEELSRLLLQGWTMLADVCPRVGCNMPLMRSRQGRVVCCSCRADIVTRNDSSTNENGTDQQSEQPQPQPQSQDQHTNRTTDQVNGEKDNNRNDSDDGNESSLQLAMTTARNASNAASNSNNDNIDNDNANGLRISESRAIMPVPSSSNNAATNNDSLTLTRDTMSAALGDKILQGWALLSSNCEFCHTPLLVNNNGNGMVTCVGCGRQFQSLVNNANNNNNNNIGSSSNSNPLNLNLHDHPSNNINTELVVGSPNRPLPPAPTATANASATSTRTNNPNSNNTATTRRPNTATTAAGHATRNPNVTRRQTNIPALEDSKPNINHQQTNHLNMPIDIDNELKMTEMAAGYNLQILRMNLPVATDAESRRVICSAMTEAAKTIEAVRKALQARMRVI